MEGCTRLLSQLLGRDLLLIQVPLQRRIAVRQAVTLLLTCLQRCARLLCCCLCRLCHAALLSASMQYQTMGVHVGRLHRRYRYLAPHMLVLVRSQRYITTWKLDGR